MTRQTYMSYPINIAHSQGAYAIELLIGSENVPVKLLIDTGSSTIAFKVNNYLIENDKCANTTQYAQCVTYGIGGWAGPVLNTTITYVNGSDQLKVKEAPFSLAVNSDAMSFLNLDGIFGLAYHHLNKGYNLKEYFANHPKAHQQSYPWDFSKKIEDSGMASFKNFLRKYPEKDITPFFTAFQERNITLNKFSLLVHRSIVFVPKKNMTLEQKTLESLNKGSFIIGDIESAKEGFVGKTKDIKVVHDAYYNTNLLSVQVQGFDAFEAEALEKSHLQDFFSNSIIDSGSSYLMLPKKMYQYIIDAFNSIDPIFVDQIKSFKEARENNKPFYPSHLDLDKWPDLYFTFEGANVKPQTLCVKADHYWQLNAMSVNQAFFTLLEQIPKWPNQAVIGLPLISSYLCIFDRSMGQDGTIKFADKIV